MDLLGWNAGIEGWTFVTSTPLAQEAGVEGYYVRLAPGHGPGTGSDTAARRFASSATTLSAFSTSTSARPAPGVHAPASGPLPCRSDAVNAPSPRGDPRRSVC